MTNVITLVLKFNIVFPSERTFYLGNVTESIAKNILEFSTESSPVNFQYVFLAEDERNSWPVMTHSGDATSEGFRS